MDCSYETVYASYVRFCIVLGQPSLDFETWMHKRDDVPKSPYEKAKEFLDKVHAGAGAV
jgi:hypothetical protein